MRRDAGLSQAELGRLVGESQQNIAYWELSTRPPRSDALPRLAEVLGVPIAELIGSGNGARSARASGPIGKTRRIFDEVSRLPRRKQEKILDVVSAMLEQYGRRSAG